MSDDHLMTAAGLDALRAEIAELETDGRERIAKQIRTAREWGDLKENAEYHAAKEAQAHLETRIKLLRSRELNAKVVENTAGDVVGFGSTVVVVDETTGREATYTLVSAGEAAPAQGRLSFDSPVAAALTGLRADEVAAVPTPRGERRMRVVSVA